MNRTLLVTSIPTMQTEYEGSIGKCIINRRHWPRRVIEKGLDGGVGIVVEKDHMAAAMEEQPLAVGQVVMDLIEIERTAGRVELAVGKQSGLIRIERLF